jgi:spore maturation protein CgeB
VKILCVCSSWRGANDAAFVKAFTQLGHQVDVIDEHYYINLWNTTKFGKLLSYISRNLNDIDEFNKKVKLQFNSFKPDLVFIYKGQWVQPATIKLFKDKGCKVINFYPDVSFTAHGKFIPACIPLYDLVFSTKSFALEDTQRLFNYSKVKFVPHGFDPDIHKPSLVLNAPEDFYCDASFIGTHSNSKEKYLKHLKKSIPGLKLNIWGSGWQYADPILENCIMKSSVHGDLYALAIQCSKINIALLSERVNGASSGDQITSRTFHIPASGGFMLHQRTNELNEYFEEDKEIGCFLEEDELVSKVKKFLEDPSKRGTMAKLATEKCISNYSVLNRAKLILNSI